MPRDPRFIALHRGGLLEPATHRLLAHWAADCAEHLLPIFSQTHPEDARPAQAIAVARAWANDAATVKEARAAAVAAHAAARAAKTVAAGAAARAAAQAVSTPHMADHALGPLYYGVKAVTLIPGALPDAAATEVAWHIARAPDAIRPLLLAALAEQTVLGRWRLR